MNREICGHCGELLNKCTCLIDAACLAAKQQRLNDESLLRQALEALSAIYEEIVERDDAYSSRQIVSHYSRDAIAALRERLGEKSE